MEQEHGGCTKLHFSFDFMEITNELLELGIYIRYGDRLQTYLQILCQILFISQQLQIWRQCETLRLYLTN
jgi:hypothetical protein